MKYDDASWHYGGDFPKGLPCEKGATHMAMFVSWCLLNNLAGSIHAEEFPESLTQLKTRKVSPTTWFIDNCDEKFTDEDLNVIGNRFAEYYYESKDGMFYEDYESTSDEDLETLYHFEDSWSAFDKLSPILKKRFDEWSATEG
ncbi:MULTISPECIES: DUF7832 domain-containing protein [Pseudoalteromonas]|uniref:DUF7832 domain-containing protein n=1 Tax=Pseudoalteromonas arctica A 37-1-2 TaxID=1117313 RepID=A0A290S2G5_9GAMM|nr:MULTISPECIES: hypothetical protein [Pseudoalteromonas]ATC86306.1 hypothetical protein PARC_a1726 [Pseudoalteromonas arctica A 37-1-2]MBH0079710.1 hypothetical protein [Pseudoalteromonas sp. NZS11]GAA68792.1 hypothetical protein P20429_2922 [Pseudoalteromonas sp. BSi20429]